MNDAPERIWASLSAERVDKVAIHGGWSSEPSKYHTYEYVRADRIEALEAKLAKAVGLLEAWIRVATHCTIEEGVCCCGAAMDTHDDPMSCGHLQVDHGAYVARGLVEETNATLAELTGGQKDE